MIGSRQGESSSMPNLQNNPNEIEDEDQKYLLVTQEMINQREKEKGKYNVLKYQQVEEKNMSDMDSGLDINKIMDKGFSLNSEKIKGSFEHNKNICVKPGVTNKKELSYCIYIEYNIKGNSEKNTNFVGTQEKGHDCNEQKFKTEGNIEKIQFIVVWSENIFFGKDDVLYASRFNVGKKELMSNDQITLNINTAEKTTKLNYDPKKKELIPDI
uniref:Uncharacterized protein n=1 Tax=Meloidogyne javanica TaxID=6303 RepID=A0A915LWR2_MELJA